jgi:hypothetical protein
MGKRGEKCLNGLWGSQYHLSNEADICMLCGEEGFMFVSAKGKELVLPCLC